jgi:hypothetical protein
MKNLLLLFLIFSTVSAAAGCQEEGGGEDAETDALDAVEGDHGTDAGDGVPDDTGPVDGRDGVDAADSIDAVDAPDDSPPPPCPAAALGARLGRDRLLVGGSMDDAQFALAPFDIRYQYVAGDVPDPGPCARCDVGCTVRGQSCANSAGCAWWGCWQYDQDPPGRFVHTFMQGAADRGAIPMISYYIWFSVAGDVEGGAEVGALADGGRVTRYLADFRFLCQVMNESSSVTGLVQVEPDLWGYGHQVSSDPEAITAAVGAASAPECSGLPDTMSGFARCMIAIARAEAPNVLVGFHASAWGAGADALINSSPGFDLAGHAARTAQFMTAVGAAGADFVTVEMSDRDAGFNGRWWDATNATLPSFTQALSWAGSVGSGMGLATLWWQIPCGHMGLPNTCDQYEDNRVDYFFDSPGQFASAGAVGIAFGAGASCMTTPATDGGHFIERASAYFSGERPLLCGE